MNALKSPIGLAILGGVAVIALLIVVLTTLRSGGESGSIHETPKQMTPHSRGHRS